jgi:transcriptional regulator with XRE-family HTH domain
MQESRTPRTIPTGSVGAAGAAGVETIGAVIARVRTEHGATQLKLAERLCAAAGVPTVTRHEISRWEREERLPNRFWLGWLALVLDLPVEQLELAVAAARRRRDDSGAHPGWHRVRPGVYAARAS